MNPRSILGSRCFHSIAIAMLWFLLFLPHSFAAVITVPGDYATIQAAINAASDGDEIIVSPGTYYENIHFLGENIILRSTDPTNPSTVASTILDGSSSGSVVTFFGTEGTTCVLSGFTITNGKAVYGAGVNGAGSSAIIDQNMVTGNDASDGVGGGIANCNGVIQHNNITRNASYFGGGLAYCDGTVEYNIISANTAVSAGGLLGCPGRITGNIIRGNHVSSYGGGLAYCGGVIEDNIIEGNFVSGYMVAGGGGLCACHGIIENNIISLNRASSEYPHGGGLLSCNGLVRNNIIWANAAQGLTGIGGGLADCNGAVENNTIYMNQSSGFGNCGGGLLGCNGTIRNCIIWQNSGERDAQLSGCATPSYCCIQGGSAGTGNIAANPALWDNHLLPGSPCIDAGCSVTLAEDFEGDARPWRSTAEYRGDGSGFDIGADEYSGPLLYDFTDSAEGWTSGTAEIFAAPEWRREAGSVRLVAANNMNTFGFWQSPANAVPANERYLYRARFVVTTDVTLQALVPTIRLRVNAASFQQADVLTIDSVGNGGASPTPSGVTYALYFVPPANDTYCMLAFDLMNFDPTDAPDAEVALDSVLVERFALSTLGSASTTWTYHFETDQGSWSTGDGQTGFTDPEFFWEAGALYLRSTTNTNTFGYWHSSDYDIATTSGLLYRGTFDVRTDVTNRSRVPQMRLRFNTENLQASRTLAIESVGDGANSPGITNTLYDRLYFLPPANCLGEGLIVSFDMLNFSPDDAPTGALILDRATIESFSPSTAP